MNQPEPSTPKHPQGCECPLCQFKALGWSDSAAAELAEIHEELEE
jgi:hypothetical protein